MEENQTQDPKEPKKSSLEIILAFLEKHKKGFQRLLYFLIAFVVISLTNNPAVTALLQSFLGDIGASAVQSVPAALCVGTIIK